MTESVFAADHENIYEHRYHGTIVVDTLVGGIPTDPKVAEGWLRTKLGDKDDLIREMVAKTMIERGIDADEAATEVDQLKHLNGFKRNDDGLYIEGRQLKACIKEAANIRWPKAKWGPSNKGTRSYFAEHLFVVEDVLSLGVAEPSGVNQRFVHTWRGSGIQYEEYVDSATFDFTLITDNKFTPDEWAALWITAEQQGIGATRSQGFGRFAVTRWERE